MFDYNRCDVCKHEWPERYGRICPVCTEAMAVKMRDQKAAAYDAFLEYVDGLAELMHVHPHLLFAAEALRCLAEGRGIRDTQVASQAPPTPERVNRLAELPLEKRPVRWVDPTFPVAVHAMLIDPPKGDNLRPRGTMEVLCSQCSWTFWVDALSPRARCPTCSGKDYPKAPDE